MKFLATADWHAFNFTDFSRPMTVKWCDKSGRYQEVEGEPDNLETREMNSRLFNILAALCDMRDYALNSNIDAMLMAGDVFHKRGVVEVSVFNPVYKVLESYKECNIPVYLLAGNHDQVDASISPISSLYGLKEVARVIETPELVNVKGVKCVFLPFSKNKDYILENLDKLKKESRGKKKSNKDSILVAHVGVTGGKVGSGMYSMKDEFSLEELGTDDFMFTVLGHYHQPQSLDESGNVIYTGTPVQNSFSDERKDKSGHNEHNGFYVLDTDDKTLEFVPIVAPMFVTVTSAKELEKLGSDFIKNNYVRVKSNTEEATKITSTMEKLSKSTDGAEIRLELEKDYTTEQRSDIGISQSFEDIVRTFAKEQSGQSKSKLKHFEDIGISILMEATTGGTN